jgi:hypothetical protein
MSRIHDPSESRLHQLRHDSRVRIVETRFALASTLCLLAGSQIVMGDTRSALATLQRIRAASSRLRVLAERYSGVFRDDGLDQRVRQIDERICELESMLGPNIAGLKS